MPTPAHKPSISYLTQARTRYRGPRLDAAGRAHNAHCWNGKRYSTVPRTSTVFGRVPIARTLAIGVHRGCVGPRRANMLSSRESLPKYRGPRCTVRIPCPPRVPVPLLHVCNPTLYLPVRFDLAKQGQDRYFSKDCSAPAKFWIAPHTLNFGQPQATSCASILQESLCP